MISNLFIERVALKTLNLLIQTKAMHYTSGTVFYVWQRGNRVIIAFDPNAIKLDRVNDGFVHDLSTRLQGRKIVRTNTRGLFLQVGLETPAVPASLDAAMPLDLSKQSTPWHLPVGMTANGPLWIPLTSGISYLVGGSTGTGKTGEEHAWIQALLHGGKTQIYAWDGKQSVEFLRYADQPNFHLMFSPEELELLREELKTRVRLLSWSGAVNIQLHNEKRPNDFIPPIALFVDEAADLPDKVKTALKEMVRLYRFAGLYPIIATNQPTQAEMFAKTNLQTRVAFKVPHHNDSITMLGYKGAELLPAICGRGLITWRGRLIEFQSFHVTYPEVSEKARELMRWRDVVVGNEQSSSSSEIVRMAEEIRSQWSPSLSKRAVGRLLGKEYAGAWAWTIDQIVEHLAATTTTSSPISPDLGATAAS